jgi:hypothetical protein
MAPIWLAKFNQAPWLDSTAHWGIFVAFEPAGNDNHGIPKTGTLFHASQRCVVVGGSCATSPTVYRQNPEFELSSSETLASTLCLEDTDVSVGQVDKACESVSLNRPFNLVTRNCQDWVKEVLQQMISENLIPQKVFLQMKAAGFETMSERSTESSNRSSVFTIWKSGAKESQQVT